MPLMLMKLLVAADTTVTIGPTSGKYFYVTTTETAAGGTLAIDAADFFDDTGTGVTELPELPAGNSFYTVSVNGVPQMTGVTAYTAGATGTGSLAITVPADGDPILVGTPVVLQIVLYTPTGTTTVST